MSKKVPQVSSNSSEPEKGFDIHIVYKSGATLDLIGNKESADNIMTAYIKTLKDTSNPCYVVATNTGFDNYVIAMIEVASIRIRVHNS
jgi:hypothetical protein